jgi:hypothetical protein
VPSLPLLGSTVLSNLSSLCLFPPYPFVCAASYSSMSVVVGRYQQVTRWNASTPAASLYVIRYTTPFAIPFVHVCLMQCVQTHCVLSMSVVVGRYQQVTRWNASTPAASLYVIRYTTPFAIPFVHVCLMLCVQTHCVPVRY